MEKFKDALVIVATCMLAGPAIALLVIYLVLLAISGWVALVAVISGAAHAGAGMLAGGLVAGLLLMPMFALAGVVIAAPLTFLVGLALTVAHYLNIAEYLASQWFSAVPLTYFRFILNFSISLAVTVVAAPEIAWAQLLNLGPLSLSFLAGISAAFCAHLAVGMKGAPKIKSSYSGRYAG